MLEYVLGAKYDGVRKAWYVPPGINVELFDKWQISKDSQCKPHTFNDSMICLLSFYMH